MVHFLSLYMKEILFAKEVYQILIISFTAETAFVDNSFVFTNRLEATVEVEGIITRLSL